MCNSLNKLHRKLEKGTRVRQRHTHVHNPAHKLHHHCKNWQALHYYEKHAHTHRHMDIHTHVLQVHSPACMWECFSSVSAPAGSMDSLINTPFHMSAFMTSKFLSCTSHVFVRCMQSIFPQMPGKGAIAGFAASQILTHENISVLLNRGFKEKYTLFLHFHHWNFMFMLIF